MSDKVYTDFSVVSAYRNSALVNLLIMGLRSKGYSCFNFTDTPADPENPNSSSEDQMKSLEETKDFMNDSYFKKLFLEDLEGLQNAKNIILLLPSGLSAHMEIGIAYGLGKNCILIGKPPKPETLYLLFNEYYGFVHEFLKQLKTKLP